MIQLFDRYNQESQDLQASLEVIGQAGIAIVLDVDGFLPDQVLSPFTYFTEGEGETGKPLFFNQVPVPDFWEITGDNQAAAIHCLNEKKAHIHYAQGLRARLVKQVDWYDQKGQTRQTDHYNHFGFCFAKTTYSADGVAIFTRYQTRDGQERLLENHVTGDLLLSFPQRPLQHFPSRLAFVHFFLEELGLSEESILFNTLALPFLLSFHHPNPSGEDILVWQEPLADSLPGNMLLILNETRLRAKTVIIPDRATYERAMELASPEQRKRIHPLGYHYLFKRENFLRKDALIVTNTDQIEHLEVLLSALPDVTFRIAAVTEMSPKLTGMLAYPNVVLYQNASPQQILELFQLSDIYLDINYANELLRSVRQAFEHNLAIFAFVETAHNLTYTAPENTFAKEDVDGLISRIKEALSGVDEMRQVLAAQGRHANYMDLSGYREQFQEIIGGNHG